MNEVLPWIPCEATGPEGRGGGDDAAAAARGGSPLGDDVGTRPSNGAQGGSVQPPWVDDRESDERAVVPLLVDHGRGRTAMFDDDGEDRRDIFRVRPDQVFRGVVHVHGGLFDALMTRSDWPHRLRFDNPGDTLGRWRLSPLARRGREWISCNIRRAGRCLTIRGILSVWKHRDGTYGVLYFDGPRVMDWIESTFAISNLERNRLMHALVGNIRDDNYYRPLTELDAGVVDDVARSLEATSSLYDFLRVTETFGHPDKSLQWGPRYNIPVFRKTDKRKSPSTRAHSDRRGRDNGPPFDATADQIALWCLLQRPPIEKVPQVEHPDIRLYVSGATRRELWPELEPSEGVFTLMQKPSTHHRMRETQDIILTRNWGFVLAVPRAVDVDDRVPSRHEIDVGLMMGNIEANPGPFDPMMDAVGVYLEGLRMLAQDGEAVAVSAHSLLWGPVAAGVAACPRLQAIAANFLGRPGEYPIALLEHTYPTHEFGPLDVYMTLGFVNGREEGLRGYEHVLMPHGGLGVLQHDAAGDQRYVVEPKEFVRVNRLSLWKKYVTYDADGKVHPEHPVLYIYRRGQQGFTDGIPKQVAHTVDGARTYRAVVGPHSCCLFVREGALWRRHFVSKETYLHLTRNYMSGVALAVVRRNTMAMFRQGRDPTVTAEDLTVWSDFVAHQTTPIVAQSLLAHSTLRSRILADAATGVLKWRWWGFWDPYAVGVDWHACAHGQPIPWHARVVIGGAALYFGGRYGARCLSAAVDGFVTWGQANAEHLSAAGRDGCSALAHRAGRCSAGGLALARMYAARLWQYYYPPPPQPIYSKMWEGFTMMAGGLFRTVVPRAECHFVAASADEPVTGFWAIPLLVLGAISSIGAGTVVVRRWRPEFFSEPMGLYSRFVSTLPRPMHPSARILKAPDIQNSEGNRVFQGLPLVGGAYFASFAKGPQNYAHSFVARVARPTPLPTPFAVVRYARNWNRVTAVCERVEPTDWDTFVGRFPPGKRRLYNEAHELLSVWGMRLFDKRAFGGKNRLLRRQCFLKHELNIQLLETSDGCAAKDPRTIMTMHDALQALYGPWFHAYGVMISSCFGCGKEIIAGFVIRFAYGMTKAALFAAVEGEHLNAVYYLVICGDDAFFRVRGVIWYVDGTRWDAHMKMHMLLPKFKHYRDLGMPEAMVDLLHRLTKRHIVYGKGYEQFIGWIEATVSSGDSDTLPGNCGKMAVSLISCIEDDDWLASAAELGLAFEVAAKQNILQDPFGDFCSCVVAGATFVLKPGKVMGKLPFVANPGFPPELVLAAKLQAAIADLKPFPELCDILLLLEDLYPWDSIPEFVRAAVRGRYQTLEQETGVVDSPALFFAERYGVEYGELVAELRRWADAALRGRDWVDMPAWSIVVAVDIGKDLDVADLPWGSAMFKRLSAS